jgi:hypothetical protein
MDEDKDQTEVERMKVIIAGTTRRTSKYGNEDTIRGDESREVNAA